MSESRARGPAVFIFSFSVKGYQQKHLISLLTCIFWFLVLKQTRMSPCLCDGLCAGAGHAFECAGREPEGPGGGWAVLQGGPREALHRPEGDRSWKLRSSLLCELSHLLWKCLQCTIHFCMCASHCNVFFVSPNSISLFLILWRLCFVGCFL